MNRVAVFLTAASAAGTFALAAPAFAGGPVAVESDPVIVPAPMPVAMASADWSGFYAGAQLGYADIDSAGAGIDGTGETFGVHAGYRWDLGNAVLGIEADWDSANVDLGGATGTLDDVARLKLSAGYDMGNTLLYATAGAAYASATVGGAELSDNGMLAGVGLTYALNDQWTVGGEVLTHWFDNFDGSGVDLDANTATIRVGYRF